MSEQRMTGASVLDSEPAAYGGVQLGSSVPPGDSYAEIHSAEERAVFNQVERILRSDELRGCEALRRLLKFLAAKSVDGEADDLKEYIVAIDGLGKPATYDPRQNSAVRIQVGRLRQKLADYYRREGQEDPVIIDLPKGRFKLKFEYRNGSTPKPARTSALPPEHGTADHSEDQKPSREETRRGFRFPFALAAGLLVGALAGSAFYWLKPMKAKATTAAVPPGWNAEMEELWQPFIATKRPLIVAIEDPLFVELNGNPGIFYRDKELNDWSSVESSARISAVRQALKTTVIQPSRYYTSYGEVEASFLVAKLLGPRVQNLNVVRTSNLSLQELGDNNVLFVGVQNLFFSEQAQATPLEAPLQPVHEGIRNLHPGPNEPALFLDQYSTGPSEDGVVYALVTRFPGPMGSNDVESFTSNKAAGYVAAVKAFTNPDSVQSIVAKLKQSTGGRMPAYFQILLKVKFKDEVPTEITYVLAREMHYRGAS